MEQVGLRQQTVAVGAVGVVDVLRLFLQQTDRFLQFADDEVIDLSHGGLLGRGLQVVVVHDADAAVLLCRSGVVGLGVGVDGYEVVEGAEGAGLGLGQRPEFLRAFSLVDVVEDEVHAQDVGVHILIEVVVAQQGAVGLLVERKVDAVEAGALEAQDVRLLGPGVVRQVEDSRRVIAAHGVDYEFVVLAGGIDGDSPLRGDVDVAVTGSPHPASP